MPGVRPSDAKLAAALREAGLDDLAARAQRGEFNDYFSQRATPKLALANILRTLDREELLGRLIDGEFDSGRDEAVEWRRSPEGERLFAELARDTPMSDPRELGGAMASLDGDTVMDASKALIVDYQDICKVNPESAAGREDEFALLFTGQINRSSDRAKVMLLGDLDFLAALITQCHGVAERAGIHDELNRLCAKRWKEMPH